MSAKCHPTKAQGSGDKGWTLAGVRKSRLAPPQTLHKGKINKKMKTVMRSRRHLLFVGDAYRQAMACHMLFLRNKNPAYPEGQSGAFKKFLFWEKSTVNASNTGKLKLRHMPPKDQNQELKNVGIKQSVQHRHVREKTHAYCRAKIQNKGDWTAAVSAIDLKIFRQCSGSTCFQSVRPPEATSMS